MTKIVNTLLFLICLSTATKAQPLFSEVYKDCPEMKPCYYCGDTMPKPTTSIRERLQWSIDHRPGKWMGSSGSMYYEILVDSTGHACVRSIRDDVRMWDIKDNLRRDINKMNWYPATAANRPINSALIMRLNFIGYRATITFIKPEDLP